MIGIAVVDLECQNHPYYGATASPRHPENYVVASGWALHSEPPTGLYMASQDEALQADWAPYLRDPSVRMLVLHNAAFDVDWLLRHKGKDFMQFLSRGGKIFCTAYAHYLLSNMQDTYPALNDIAPQYGGTHKVDGVKILWEQGKLTSEIDKALLFDEYLIGPEGDIENTRTVFLKQHKLLHERNMWRMVMLRMDGLLFNCFCMAAGLHVSREVAEKNMQEAQALLGDAEQVIESYRQHMSEVAFKTTSKHHMSAWLFGGPLKYAARVPALDENGEQKYEKTDCYLTEDTNEYVPVENVADDFSRPLVTYKSGKNKGQPKVFKVEDHARPKMKNGDVIFQCQPLFDLNLLPKELRESFLKDFSTSLTLSDGSPVISTSADAIEALCNRPEFDELADLVNALRTYAKVHKDLSTYYLTETRNAAGEVTKVSGMLQYLTPDDKVHHQLQCTSTVTGRLSSNRPNMQNLPRGDSDDSGYVSKVKEMFTSRFGDDGVILGVDYSALEVVVLACLSGDQGLIDALLKGTDMHCLRLAKKLGEDYSEVLEKCKNQEHPEHAKYKQMRTDIKPMAFAYQYGATAHGIAFATGCSVEEAAAFIEAEKALFPRVEEYFDEVAEQVEDSATRHREEYAPGQWRLYCRGTRTMPCGTRYEFRQYPKTEWVDGQRTVSMQFKPTQMRNYECQGTAGLFVQGMLGAVIRHLISNKFYGWKCIPINQVHDAIYCDVHKDVVEEAKRDIENILQQVPAYFSHFGYNMPVPFPVEGHYGASMQEA